MGLEVTEDELDPEMREMLNVWLDFEEFGILPWNRNAASKDVITYYKNGIRFINQMKAQAKANQSNRRVDSDIADDMRKKDQRRRQVGR